MHQLSKTDFKFYLDCPESIWLLKNKPDEYPKGEFSLFAEKLIEKMPGLERVYYSNSGSEANEKGYKMVRQLAHIEGDGSKLTVIYRNRDYHGTTIGALSSAG